MIWFLLIMAAIIANPLLIEPGRETMDDNARGATRGQFAE